MTGVLAIVNFLQLKCPYIFGEQIYFSPHVGGKEEENIWLVLRNSYFLSLDDWQCPKYQSCLLKYVCVRIFELEIRNGTFSVISSEKKTHALGKDV